MADFDVSESAGADPRASDEAPQWQVMPHGVPTPRLKTTDVEHVLKNLNTSKLISNQCFQAGLQLVEFASTNQELLDHLKTFIGHLEKSLKTPIQNPESGVSDSNSGGIWQYFGISSKVKVATVVSGETYGAYKFIKNKLKSKVDIVSNHQDCDIIVLFCPISSRVGSDVEAALKKLEASGTMKPVILVLMHHTRNIYHSADESDWSEDYPIVESHVHVLFHETQKGLLTCPKNDQAIQSLLNQCSKRVK